MGEVYEAFDRELDEVVALKIMHESLCRDPEALTRFRHEAKAARRLSHPNIVRIHDIGEEEGRRHLSMEYVMGGNLGRRLHDEEWKVTLDDAVSIIRQIARGLIHAHTEGVLHLDIKPSNILMDSPSRVKISDFGIAAILSRKTGRPEEGTDYTSFGTPLYMSPEQFEGGELTWATDFYSLGVLFYELVAGNPPFMKGSLAYHHVCSPPPPLPEGTPDLIRGVIARCLEKEPRRRYPRGNLLLQELDEYDGSRRDRR